MTRRSSLRARARSASAKANQVPGSRSTNQASVPSLAGQGMVGHQNISARWEISTSSLAGEQRNNDPEFRRQVSPGFRAPAFVERTRDIPVPAQTPLCRRGFRLRPSLSVLRAAGGAGWRLPGPSDMSFLPAGRCLGSQSMSRAYAGTTRPSCGKRRSSLPSPSGQLTQAAEAADISRRQAHRWLTDPDFHALPVSR